MKKDLLEIEKLLEEMIVQQKTLMENCGRRIIPHLTADDFLQPNDFEELESHPVFRYEEGMLAGMLSMQAALRAWYKVREK